MKLNFLKFKKLEAVKFALYLSVPVFIVWLIGHPEFLEKEIQKRRYITIVDTPQPESPEATKEQINKIKHAMRRRPSNDSSEKVE